VAAGANRTPIRSRGTTQRLIWAGGGDLTLTKRASTLFTFPRLTPTRRGAAVPERPVYPDAADAVADVPNGATIMIGGFAGVGIPLTLVRALSKRELRGLTTISNGTTHGPDPDLPGGVPAAHQVARAICSFPVRASVNLEDQFERAYENGTVQLEIVPQGTLAERIRAGGAGIAAFYTPTGVGTPFAAGKEVRDFDGRPCVLEHGLRADFALIKAFKADTMGNLIYRNAMRNFNPIMATAAQVTIAEVDEIVPVRALDPEAVVTPGIYVHRIVVANRSTHG
jgi:3-oxoacid CoA-transferase A subunit